MSPWLIYLITRCDAIGAAFITLAVMSALVAVAFFIALITLNENFNGTRTEKERKRKNIQ